MESVRRMLIFLLVVFSIYLIENAYIYIRLIQFLSLSGSLLLFLKIGLWLIVLAYPAGRVLERAGFRVWAHHLTWVGSFWLGAMVYLFFGFLIFDLFRIFAPLAFRFRFPKVILGVDALRSITALLTALTAFLLFFGYLRARNPGVSYVAVPLKKLPAEKNPLRIVHLSDIHLGTIIGLKRLSKIVRRVNDLTPDLILITGDLVDEDVVALEAMVEPLSKMKAKLGIFAVTGNHEYYAGATKAIEAMKKAGISVLRNEVVSVDNFLNLAGVDDLESERFENKPFPNLRDLSRQCNPAIPSFLLCHRPIHLQEAEAAGFDLQLSGHTHHGQLIPFNWVTDLVYEISSGFGYVGKMAVYVSNGVGTWGPPVRIGAPPEIVEIILTRNGKKS